MRYTYRFGLPISTVGILLTIFGCASPRPMTEQEEWDYGLKRQKDEAELRNPTVHLLDNANYAEFARLVKENGSNSDSESQFLRRVQGVYCEGTKPRITVKYKKTFYPDVLGGQPLDIAAKETAEQIDNATYFYQHDFFYVSGNGKELSEYTIRQVRHHKMGGDYRGLEYHLRVNADDMQFLLEHFTFVLPKNVADSLYNDHEDDFHVNRLGWSTGKFNPSEAIDFKDYIWRYTLVHDTVLKVAPTEEATEFEMTWTPDLFCKYAVPITELKS